MFLLIFGGLTSHFDVVKYECVPVWVTDFRSNPQYVPHMHCSREGYDISRSYCLAFSEVYIWNPDSI